MWKSDFHSSAQNPPLASHRTWSKSQTLPMTWSLTTFLSSSHALFSPPVILARPTINKLLPTPRHLTDWPLGLEGPFPTSPNSHFSPSPQALLSLSWRTPPHLLVLYPLSLPLNNMISNDESIYSQEDKLHEGRDFLPPSHSTSMPSLEQHLAPAAQCLGDK